MVSTLSLVFIFKYQAHSGLAFFVVVAVVINQVIFFF